MIGDIINELHLVDNKLITQFDKRAIKSGIQLASHHLLHSLGITINLATKAPTIKGPTLLIANHRGGLDSHALLSIVKREDFYFVALSTYYIFGQALTQRLLPIYRRKSWNRRLFEYPLNIKLDTQVQNIPVSEIINKNRSTITEAARRVSAGSMVSIFPEGSVGRSINQSHWKAGVGYLIKQINNSNTKIIFAQISGHNKSDLYRYIREDWRKVLFREKDLIITFTSPIQLNKLDLQKKTGKEIAARLEQIYQTYFPTSPHTK